MTIDDPISGGLVRAVSMLCQQSDYFDGRFPTPKTYEEYEATPILDGCDRYTREELEQALLDFLTAKALASARKIWTTVADFYAEFTGTEKYLIQSSTVPAILVARGDLAMWRGDVWSDNADVLAGLDAMVTAGVLTAERRAEILAK